MTVADIRRAAQAFQGALSSSYWEEHGIDDEEAEKGLLVALHELGILDEGAVQQIKATLDAEREAENDRQQAEYAERQEVRLAAMTPEERAAHARLAGLLAESSRQTKDLILANLNASVANYHNLFSDAETPPTD